MELRSKIITTVILIIIVAGCSDNNSSRSSIEITPGDDPYFTIVGSDDNGLEFCNRKVEVFGISVYAVPDVEDVRLLHAANVMAQYLDNDEDGHIDNPQVVDEMIAVNAFIVMWKNESDLDEINPPDNAAGQDLGNDETVPAWHSNGHTGRFDACLEEVWHIITHAGYANAYPDVFGEHKGSVLADAMDIARGGQFVEIPEKYPSAAWYSYDDQTCDYSCMVTEYFYWAMTSILGAQSNRLDEIEHEWKLNTKALVQTVDKAVYNLLTDIEYKLPTTLPDGTYRR